MNGSGPSSATPSSSPVIRPRRSPEWNEFRPIIEGLYRNQQLKLRDVKEIMEREHNFVATQKQFKDRLAVWHVRKNIKANERDIMIRKQQKRAARGKQTAFRVGGHNIDARRISRFARRYGSSVDSPQSDSRLGRSSRSPTPEPSTPSDMSCYTPEPEDRSSDTLSPVTDLQSDSQDDRFFGSVDGDADEGRSVSDALSPPASQPAVSAATSLPNNQSAAAAAAAATGGGGGDVSGLHTDDPRWLQIEQYHEKMAILIQDLDKRLREDGMGQIASAESGENR